MEILYFLIILLASLCDASDLEKSLLKMGVDVTATVLNAAGIPLAGDLLKLAHGEIDDQDDDFRSNVLEMFSIIDRNIASSTSVILGKLNENTIETDVRTKLNLKLEKMSDLLNEVESLHRRYKRLLNSGPKSENDTLVRFADKNIAMQLDERIYQLLRGPKGQSEKINNNVGLLELLAMTMNSSSFYCSGYMTSPQQTLTNYFNQILRARNQAYFMTLFSFTILIMYRSNDHKYKSDVEFFQEDSLSQLKHLEEIYVTASTTLSREFWRCNPRDHIRDRTYLEASRTLQAIIVHKNDELYRTEDYTKEQSDYYDKIHVHDLTWTLCHTKMEYCEGTYPRRYEFIKMTHKLLFYWYNPSTTQYFGREKECDEEKYKSIVTIEKIFCREKNAHLVGVRVFFDRNDDAHRYFDLHPVTSEVEANRVITGIRFVKENGIFRLQIQQGELVENGLINQSTVKWRELDANSGDNYALNKYEKQIDLSDIETEKNQVVTGVRLTVNNGRLKLIIRGSSIDFANGKLLSSSNWIETENSKQEFNLTFPDNIIKRINSNVSTKSIHKVHVQRL